MLIYWHPFPEWVAPATGIEVALNSGLGGSVKSEYSTITSEYSGSTEPAEPPVPAAAQNTRCGTVFAELAAPGQMPECAKMRAPAVICRGDIRIEIPDSVSEEFLLRIMKAVSHV